MSIGAAKEMVNLISKLLKINYENLVGTRITAPLVEARAMTYKLFGVMGYSNADVANAFGRDPAAIHRSLRYIDTQMGLSPSLRKKYLKVEAEVKRHKGWRKI